MTGLIMLLPTTFAPTLLVLGGIAVMVGAKQLARTLFVTVGVMAFAPVILGPLLAAVPTWLLLLSLPVLAFSLVGAGVTAVFGRRVWEEALGHWIARFLGPLLLISTGLVLFGALF